MGGMGGVGQARSGLARVVVKLHQTEDQVRGHQLKLVRRVCDDISAHMENYIHVQGSHLRGNKAFNFVFNVILHRF